MSQLVAGKLAFVTGAGSGIGRAVCRVLAREGAKVVVTDQNVTSAHETLTLLEGSEHMAMDMEVTNPQRIEKAFKKVMNHFSRAPNVIVNSAGITRDNFLLKLNSEDFDNVINVNLKGTFLVMQNAVKALLETGNSHQSSIINISSVITKTGNIGQSNYSASKAAVEGLTKTASLEFGQFGVRVNVVLPGFIDTPMVKTVPDEIKKLYLKKVPLNRIGTPQDVAEVIAFLASDRSSYVNGTSIQVTGGMN